MWNGLKAHAEPAGQRSRAHSAKGFSTAKIGFSKAQSQNKQIIDRSQSETDDPNNERRYRPAARVENEKDDTGSRNASPKICEVNAKYEPACGGIISRFSSDGRRRGSQ